MVKSLQFLNGGGSSSQARSFYKGLIRVCTPHQDGVTNPEIVYRRFVTNLSQTCAINKKWMQIKRIDSHKKNKHQGC